MPFARTDAENTLRDAWVDWIAGMGEWHVFGGLTYDPKRRIDPARGKDPIMPSDEVVLRHVRQWLRESQRRLGRDVEAAVVAVEHHKSGWPHAHPLVRVAGGLQGNEFATLGTVWYERHGYAKLERPLDQGAVSAYASKYLSKDLASGDVIFWPSRGPLNRHQPELSVPQRARIRAGP